MATSTGHSFAHDDIRTNDLGTTQKGIEEILKTQRSLYGNASTKHMGIIEENFKNTISLHMLQMKRIREWLKQANGSPKQGQPNGIYTITLYGVDEFGFKVATA
ncbi:hypothetical protein [Cytobacillus dafuensis]|uniref:Uncharacterized protein n=1 Tax=Cytobacillus dafuensis TaxID=1742359 RepID=A0A5B8ZA29_CYTDA|nr:hypothetical protein [Cytobacillus dafuensis]QED48346.1 hypothetical protein FSZ17_14480 [Cytobacillus dafuensis]